jgi:hypothetical protein
MSTPTKSNKKQINHDDFCDDTKTIKPVVVKKSKRKSEHNQVNMKNMIPLFLDWLENNNSQFGFKPYVSLITEHNVKVYFQGILPSILSGKLYIFEEEGYEDCLGFSIEINRSGIFHQYLSEFSVTSMCNRNGYYDEYATPREYFKDEESLVKNLFEDVLKWCNKNLDCAKGVYLPHSSDECARLVTDFHMDILGKGTYYRFKHLLKNKKLSDKTKLGVLRDAFKVIHDWIEKQRTRISV